jgi:large subunit ribosomal protein L6
MSRIGKLPITLPAGVTVTVDAENVVTVTSSKGTLNQKVSKLIKVTVENNQVIVERGRLLCQELMCYLKILQI